MKIYSSKITLHQKFNKMHASVEVTRNAHVHHRDTFHAIIAAFVSAFKNTRRFRVISIFASSILHLHERTAPAQQVPACTLCLSYAHQEILGITSYYGLYLCGNETHVPSYVHVLTARWILYIYLSDTGGTMLDACRSQMTRFNYEHKETNKWRTYARKTRSINGNNKKILRGVLHSRNVSAEGAKCSQTYSTSDMSLALRSNKNI